MTWSKTIFPLLLCLAAGQACGGGDEASSSDAASKDEGELSIEEKIKEKGKEIKDLYCQVKALSDYGDDEYDTEEKKRLEGELQKLHKKVGNLLNKNGLTSKQTVNYTRKYLNPSLDTTDC